MATETLVTGVLQADGKSGLRGQFRDAMNDVVSGFRQWRVWTMLASNEMRGRYRRSGIGQFWMTISMAVTIVAMGLLWGMIFHTDVRNTLPFIGIGLMAWTLLSGIVLETASAFVASESYLKQIRVAKTALINQVILRNLIVFAHYVVLAPIILLVFPPTTYLGFALVPLGIAIYVVNGLWLGLLLGTLCVRFRDLPPIVASFMQVMAFITPVYWNPSQVGPSGWYVVHLNPLSSYLTVLREPLLGIVPNASDYLVVLGVTVLGSVVAAAFFARFRARIVYWL